MTAALRIGRWMTETGRWLAGMMLDDGSRIIACNAEERETSFPKWVEPDVDVAQAKRASAWAKCNTRTPDLTDGPTRGALEDILLEAWPFAVVLYLEGREPEYSYAVQEYHTIDALNPGHDVRGVSRGAAVAAALIIAHEIPEYE